MFFYIPIEHSSFLLFHWEMSFDINLICMVRLEYFNLTLDFFGYHAHFEGKGIVHKSFLIQKILNLCLKHLWSRLPQSSFIEQSCSRTWPSCTCWKQLHIEFSLFPVFSVIVQLSQTTSAYSKQGLMKKEYISEEFSVHAFRSLGCHFCLQVQVYFMIRPRCSCCATFLIYLNIIHCFWRIYVWNCLSRYNQLLNFVRFKLNQTIVWS